MKSASPLNVANAGTVLAAYQKLTVERPEKAFIGSGVKEGEKEGDFTTKARSHGGAAGGLFSNHLRGVRVLGFVVHSPSRGGRIGAQHGGPADPYV